jgi:beta-glucanase (GH16 family)
MKKVRLIRTGRKLSTAILSTAIALSAVPVTSFAAPEASGNVDDGYSLVWSEEFDGDGLNTNDWNVEQHEPGWVNRELQRYTGLDEGNIEVEDGVLKIKPRFFESSEEVQEENNDEATESEDSEAKETSVSFKFDYSGDTRNDTTFQINFGLIGDGFEGTSTAAKVELTGISFVDDTDPENVVVICDSFSSDNWGGGANGGAGSVDYADGKAYVEITDPGSENWHFQIQTTGFELEDGHHYSIELDATSNVDRAVEMSVLSSNWVWFGGTKGVIEGSGASSEGTENGGSSSGKSEITSGRITTQGKHDFTYGRFEARAKVPEGKGYLPAFWLMATDEGNYGQWPRCGEVDIMEVMGQSLDTSYHTIHYGYDSTSGHKENQGRHSFAEGNLADEFHDYAVEWDPGKITWFVDDEEVYSTSDWYTGTDDDNQITYPAPFDQDFYIILNLAVGGSWVGNPDEDTYENMNDKSYEVDYVRVYQKSQEEYERLEKEAKRPEKEPVKFREADESGNYVINGDFSKDIHLDGALDADKNNWKLHLESDAKDTTYTVNNNKITITPSAVGSQNHSVQLKQENIPMIKGYEYELSFDASASEDRTVIVDVEGPDRGWDRYFNDTQINVGTSEQHYVLTFTMDKKSDANGSLEFNLGKQSSTGEVTISNVRLIHKSGEEALEDQSKVIRPDGNYIYNGSFDQGEGRLGYWEISDEDKQYVSVTNAKNVRELKVTVPEGRKVTVAQSELSPIAKGSYDLTFKARKENTEAADGISVEVAGKTYVPELSDENIKFSKKLSFENDNSRDSSFVKLTFSKPGTYYLDDIFLSEAALIKNGSFNAGISGFSPFSDSHVKTSYVIDNMNGNDNVFAMNIEDTVAEDNANAWYIQLNQDGVTLEEGKTYRLSLDLKSSIERKVSYCMQEFEGSWTNYSNTGVVEIGPQWKTFTSDFTMTSPTDTKARFNVTMGSVEGIRITEKHDVYVDNISLIEIDGSQAGSDDPDQPGTTDTEDPDQPDKPGVEPGTEPGNEPGDNPGDEPLVGPGTDDPSVEPGTEPGNDPGTTDPEPEPEPEPTPQKPTYNPIVNIIVPVVKAVTRVVKTVFSILRRLFW